MEEEIPKGSPKGRAGQESQVEVITSAKSGKYKGLPRKLQDVPVAESLSVGYD